MATPIIMPRQGQSVESCILSKWHKKKGDQVQVGDLLFSYETDKASFDEESKVSGTLLDVFFSEGDDIPVLANVCAIGNSGESADEFNPNKTSAGGESNAEVPENSTSLKKPEPEDQYQSLVKPDAESDDGRVKISPRAKNLADKAHVDYSYAGASGPYGRIVEKDVLTLIENGPVATSAAQEGYKQAAGLGAQGTGLGGRITTQDLSRAAEGYNRPAEVQQTGAAAAGAAVTGNAAGAAAIGTAGTAGPIYEEVKLPNIRKVIAKAMHQSLSTTAQLTFNTTFDATDILDFRKKLKENKERLGLSNITINDIILYAVSRTLLNHRDLNAHFLDDKMRYFNNVNLGVAVDTERGLMVPTIFNANLKSLNEISAESKKLVKDCQTGSINPDMLRDGSFTVTNLGALDIESFTPVLNPPQTGILGVDSIVQRAREVNGEYEFYPAMGLSLTFDHRALDGAPAARFLQELRTNLENFSVLLVK